MTRDEARLLKLLNWSMPLYMVVFGTAWGVFAQNIPPFPASTDAAVLATFFRDNAGVLKIAYAICVLSSALWVTWAMALFGLMRRMEGPRPVWAYLQLLGGSLTGMVVMIASLFWYAAAFRPETDPAIIQLLYDLGWLTIDGAFGVTSLHFISCSIVFLSDKRSVPLIPRPVSWFGIFMAFDFLTELIMPYFRSGPFSWSGLFNYWVPFYAGFLWLTLMSVFAFRAIDRLADEDAAAANG